MRSLLLSGLVRLFRLVCIFFACTALVACEGCRSSHILTPPAPDGALPDARLYLVSDMAGALEPCGCVKDQLGGMDHFGALVEKEKKSAKGTATLSAGPLFFLDMELSDDRRAQEVAKAETIAKAMQDVGLAAFAPGRNDWAGGAGELGTLGQASDAKLLAANLTAQGVAPVKWTKISRGRLTFGVIGVAAPDKAKVPLEGVTSSAPSDAVKEGVTALKADGVQVIIALAAVGRGEAKRIADANPELLAIVVGSTGGGGEANTQAPPPERIGDVLIVETANHLQTVGVLDLYLRDDAKGLVKFADSTGIERLRKRQEVSDRIDELRGRIAQWENDKSVDPKDIAARKADLAKLEAERDSLTKSEAPTSGSFYQYIARDIRDDLGKDDAVSRAMLAYYKQVNDTNKRDLASRVPKPAAKGEPSYVGIEMCTSCHDEPRKVWDATRHAHAYETLSKQFKEYNLDCVSCHVTGYDRPGGSTVTHVDNLKDVQCEVCHGPGSLHMAKPEKVKMPVPKPEADTCLACHHPPHVHVFDAKAKMAEILGPGHGKPKN
ncbi:MAG TPA: multiheme c-type cytochrome [Labilithrix sp.]